MRSKLLEEREGRRAFVVVFDIGDEVAGGLAQFAREQQLGGSALTAIGALRDATLGFWDWETKDYARIPIQEQVEVVSLVGNIARGPDGSPNCTLTLWSPLAMGGRTAGTCWRRTCVPRSK
jgi:predicted DNA-binding protein with PD1-like motif